MAAIKKCGTAGRMTYQMSFAIMVHMGFRTHDGTPLSKLPYFVQRFEVGTVAINQSTLILGFLNSSPQHLRIEEAYAIQRAMGQNLHPSLHFRRFRNTCGAQIYTISRSQLAFPFRIRYEYAFPSTFLLPFVSEPLVTIYASGSVSQE